jgi:AraC-like DNA-binding protein
MKLYKLVFTSLFFLINFFIYSQSNTDTLRTKSFDKLSKLIDQNRNYPKTRDYINQYYINKAKKDNNSSKIMSGYHYMTIYNSKNKKNLIYSDSLLTYSLENKNKFYTCAALKSKGNYFYYHKQFTEAIDYYLKAQEYAQNKFLYYENSFNIALIKTRIGKHREALSIYKEILAFSENIYEERKNKKNKYPKSNLTYYKNAIACSYINLGILDSASYYNKIVLKESKEINDKIMYHSTLLNSGIIDYFNNSYHKAIKNLKIAGDFFNYDDYIFYTGKAYYYIGEAYLKTNKKNDAIIYFKKVDSIFNVSKDLMPITRNSYKHLINHYKDKKNFKKQLKYLLQLKKVDSITSKYYSYANTKLLKEYDLPIIIGETKKINALLEKKKNFLNNVIGVISFVLIGVLSLLVFQYRRRKLYKARFNEIVHTETQPATNELEKNIEELTFSKEIITHILTSLEKFEQEKKYINSGITLQSLSKGFNTNSNYLSKVVNYYKRISFSKYLTSLRINYVIEELKVNETFRKYTIKAISKEIGFNNAESFSKAFYAKTGIKPSYFIKELEKIK